MNNSVECRICGKLFGSSDQEKAQHRKLHSDLAGGLLPANICVFIEDISLSVFRGGPVVNSFSEDSAKVAFVFSQWHRALRKGVSKRKFNEFLMISSLMLILFFLRMNPLKIQLSKLKKNGNYTSISFQC